MITPGRRWTPPWTSLATGSRSRCPITGWASCITCTPTMWRRRSSVRCPAGGDRGQLSRRRRAGDDSAGWRRRGRSFGREPVLDFVTGRSSPAGRAEHAGPPASTRSAASPPASPAPARYSATRRATAHSMPCARLWPGSSLTARPTPPPGQPFPREARPGRPARGARCPTSPPPPSFTMGPSCRSSPAREDAHRTRRPAGGPAPAREMPRRSRCLSRCRSSSLGSRPCSGTPFSPATT